MGAVRGRIVIKRYLTLFIIWIGSSIVIYLLILGSLKQQEIFGQ